MFYENFYQRIIMSILTFGVFKSNFTYSNFYFINYSFAALKELQQKLKY